MSPTDHDSRIGKMKDGRTHLLYKAEHVVDLGSEVVLAVPIYHGDEADVDTMVDSVMDAQTNLSEAGIDVEIEEAVADKGYHATDTLELADSLHIRSYVPEPKRRGKRNWQGRARREASGGDQQSGVAPEAHGASDCNVCEANEWKEASPMCVTLVVPGGVGCVGSRRSKSVT